MVLISLVLVGWLVSLHIWFSGFCDSKCGVRCANAGVKDRCIRYCGVCCQQCNCVPSGTYGNKSECPCYRDKLNSKGNPKCPWLFIMWHLPITFFMFCTFWFRFLLGITLVGIYMEVLFLLLSSTSTPWKQHALWKCQAKDYCNKL